VTASAVSRGSKECKEEKLEVLVLFDKGGQWRLALGTNGGKPRDMGRESSVCSKALATQGVWGKAESRRGKTGESRGKVRGQGSCCLGSYVSCCWC